jgi:virulence factor Mce-like protein
MRGRSDTSIVGSPILVGAVTVLVTVVAVFLSYNANQGLPFVPTAQLNVEIRSGANLVEGNEVRVGGTRVGVIEKISIRRLPDGTMGAELRLKLEKKAAPIPADTRFRVRPLSTLGLKYLEMTRGESPRMLADGSTLPASRVTIPVELDEAIATFDAPTRDAQRRVLRGFGDATAGRGTSLNAAITEVRPLLGRLTPVARNLAAPSTRLRRFISESADLARTLAPEARVLSDGIAAAATTFDALSRDPEALQGTIERTPETLAVAETSLRAQRPFLTDLAGLGRDLQPAARDLRASLPVLNPALESGATTLPQTVPLWRRTEITLTELRRLAEAPETATGLEALNATVGTLNPMLRFLGPHQTVCNQFNYFFTHFTDHISEGDAFGNAQRAGLVLAGRQDNSVMQAGAVEPANGENHVEGTGDPQFLHAQAFPAAVTASGQADCEGGQRGYPRKLARLATDPRFQVAVDPRTPGAQGPTYAGRRRVPRGQTYSPEPEIGEVVPFAPKPGRRVAR